MGEPGAGGDDAAGVVAEPDRQLVRWRRGLVPGAVLFRPHQANGARIYDHLLGGKDNFQVDRDAAGRLERLIPDVRSQVRENRYYLGRVVGALVELGVRQFIDLGSGLPARDNTHEIVRRRLREKARTTGGDVERWSVVYVDYDELVCVHGRTLAKGAGEGVAMVCGDLRTPEKVMADENVRRLIDFRRPVAVLMIAVLHFVTEEGDPAAITAGVWDLVPEGSCLAISHACGDGMPRERLEAAVRVYASASAPMVPRSTRAITGLFDGWDLQEPGVCDIADWRPELVRIAGNGAPWVRRSGASVVWRSRARDDSDDVGVLSGVRVALGRSRRDRPKAARAAGRAAGRGRPRGPRSGPP